MLNNIDNNYLVKIFILVSRDEFSKIVAYGKSYLYYDICESIDDIFELMDNIEINDDIAYFILEYFFDKSNRNSIRKFIELDKINRVYALSEPARDYYTKSYSGAIEFFDINKLKYFPINSHVKKFEKSNYDRAWKCLEKILPSLFSNINLKFFDVIYEKLELFEVFSFYELKEKNVNDFYTYLLSYKRINPFINDDKSFFYDLMIIYLLLSDNNGNYIKQYYHGMIKVEKAKSYIEINQSDTVECLATSPEQLKEFKDHSSKYDKYFLLKGFIFLKLESLLKTSQNFILDTRSVIDGLFNSLKDDCNEKSKEAILEAIGIFCFKYRFDRINTHYYKYLLDQKSKETQLVTPEPVTPEPVTPEPVTPEPVTPEPVTPEPVTPEPVTPEPVTPEPVTPEPVTPEPVTPEPVTPEPVTPEPVTPEPVTPEAVTPEAVTPEAVTPELVSSTQFPLNTQDNEGIIQVLRNISNEFPNTVREKEGIPSERRKTEIYEKLKEALQETHLYKDFLIPNLDELKSKTGKQIKSEIEDLIQKLKPKTVY